VAVVPLPTTPTPPPVHPETARVDVGLAKSNNAATTAMEIGHALAPVVGRFTTCYQRAVAAAPPGSIAAGDGRGTLHVETDDQGYVTLARVDAALPAAAARCIEALARTVHVQVDTGTANADVPLRFQVQ
jgi:hypothetical protein